MFCSGLDGLFLLLIVNKRTDIVNVSKTYAILFQCIYLFATGHNKTTFIYFQSSVQIYLYNSSPDLTDWFAANRSPLDVNTTKFICLAKQKNLSW